MLGTLLERPWTPLQWAGMAIGGPILTAAGMALRPPRDGPTAVPHGLRRPLDSAPSYGVPGSAAGCLPESGSGAGSGSGSGAGREAQKADRPGVFPVSR